MYHGLGRTLANTPKLNLTPSCNPTRVASKTLKCYEQMIMAFCNCWNCYQRNFFSSYFGESVIIEASGYGVAINCIFVFIFLGSPIISARSLKFLLFSAMSFFFFFLIPIGVLIIKLIRIYHKIWHVTQIFELIFVNKKISLPCQSMGI